MAASLGPNMGVTSGPYAPETQPRDVPVPRGCARCRTPYGVSSVPCPNCAPPVLQRRLAELREVSGDA